MEPRTGNRAAWRRFAKGACRASVMMEMRDRVPGFQDAQTRSPGRCRGSSSPEVRRSVTGSNGRSAPAPEAIVEPHGDHVHVLADAVTEHGRKARIDPDAEGVVRTSHEQMVVFDTDRPVRREAILKADTHR